MRKIVIHLNDKVVGIAIDDNASDKEIKEQVLEEVIDSVPRVCGGDPRPRGCYFGGV